MDFRRSWIESTIKNVRFVRIKWVSHFNTYKYAESLLFLLCTISLAFIKITLNDLTEISEESTHTGFFYNLKLMLCYIIIIFPLENRSHCELMLWICYWTFYLFSTHVWILRTSAKVVIFLRFLTIHPSVFKEIDVEGHCCL